jgi:mRNA interferase MazF
VLLSRDAAYGVRSAVTVAEITSTIRNIPVEVPLDISDGLPKKCVANLDTIITIPKAHLDTLITTLGQEKIKQINEAIKFALSL